MSIEYRQIRSDHWPVVDTHYSQQYLGAGKTKAEVLSNMQTIIIEQQLHPETHNHQTPY